MLFPFTLSLHTSTLLLFHSLYILLHAYFYLQTLHAYLYSLHSLFTFSLSPCILLLTYSFSLHSLLTYFYFYLLTFPKYIFSSSSSYYYSVFCKILLSRPPFLSSYLIQPATEVLSPHLLRLEPWDARAEATHTDKVPQQNLAVSLWEQKCFLVRV